MGGRGPAPKPAHLRQRTNKKAGGNILSIVAEAGAKVPTMPNPDGRVWHQLTVTEWRRWWESPMASQWIDSDLGGLGVLILLHDEYFKAPNVEAVKEIRLQRPCFGLTPLDRSRLQWEVAKGEAAEQQQQRRQMSPKRTGTNDPRRGLMAVK